MEVEAGFKCRLELSLIEVDDALNVFREFIVVESALEITQLNVNIAGIVELLRLLPKD